MSGLPTPPASGPCRLRSRTSSRFRPYPSTGSGSARDTTRRLLFQDRGKDSRRADFRADEGTVSTPSDASEINNPLENDSGEQDDLSAVAGDAEDANEFPVLGPQTPRERQQLEADVRRANFLARSKVDPQELDHFDMYFTLSASDSDDNNESRAPSATREQSPLVGKPTQTPARRRREYVYVSWTVRGAIRKKTVVAAEGLARHIFMRDFNIRLTMTVGSETVEFENEHRETAHDCSEMTLSVYRGNINDERIGRISRYLRRVCVECQIVCTPEVRYV